MSSHQPNPEPATQAIFSICADAQVVDGAILATSQLPGAVFVGEFHDYITIEKRPQFSPALRNAAACVALIDFDRDAELALKTAERLQQIFLRKLNIIAIGSHIDGPLLLRAMRCGCNEYLTKPVDTADLRASLGRFHNSQAVESQSPAWRGRVLPFFGAKGGVGTTTLSVYLAMQLVRRHRKKVLLIDHQHELGHAALYLGLKDGQYHFGDLIRNADRLDADLLNGFIVRHISGLDVIASPDVCAPQHKGTSDDVDRVLDFLRQHYDYILIDSSLRYQEATLAIIGHADEVYLVSTPDVAALRDLARHVEHISLTDSSVGKLRVVVNRSTSNDAVTAEQIEKAVRFPVSIAIPNNYAELVRAINDGEPVSAQHRSEFNQQLAIWSNQIVNDGARPEAVKPKKSSFAFWR